MIHCEGTLTPIALYISTFVSHKDRAGFIDEPKTSSSLRKTGLTFSLDELLFVFVFVFSFSYKDEPNIGFMRKS
jgi:hypothetical protein